MKRFMLIFFVALCAIQFSIHCSERNGQTMNGGHPCRNFLPENSGSPNGPGVIFVNAGGVPMNGVNQPQVAYDSVTGVTYDPTMSAEEIAAHFIKVKKAQRAAIVATQETAKERQERHAQLQADFEFNMDLQLGRRLTPTQQQERFEYILKTARLTHQIARASRGTFSERLLETGGDIVIDAGKTLAVQTLLNPNMLTTVAKNWRSFVGWETATDKKEKEALAHATTTEAHIQSTMKLQQMQLTAAQHEQLVLDNQERITRLQTSKLHYLLQLEQAARTPEQKAMIAAELDRSIRSATARATKSSSEMPPVNTPPAQQPTPRLLPQATPVAVVA